MIYSLDKATKQNILAQYKQAALNYRQKKQNERIKRIQEEREYILDLIKKERETDIKLREEKNKLKNEQMKEYHDLIKKFKYDIPGYHFRPRKDTVINKNWGNRSIETNIPNNRREINKNKNEILIKNLNPRQKEREYIRKEDNMNNYLTDDNNNKEFERYLIQQKEKRQKYYREILDSQYKEIQNKNKELYGTIDPLIVKREKRKNISVKPYSQKASYDFGQSALSHNPITNPENNILYNKYLFKINTKNIFKDDMRNGNVIKNGHIYNNNIEQFRTINDQKHNLAFNNSKSSINIFRNEPIKKNDNFTFDDKNNINNGNTNDKGRNYINIHSTPTSPGKTLRQAGASSIFS